MDEHAHAILFPHCFIDRDRLKGAIGLFGSLEICLPWEMDLKIDTGDEELVPFIRLLRPPEALKPGAGFGGLLAEYRQWMRFHQDKSAFTFLSALQGRDSGEEKSWEIRKRLRGERGEVERTREDQPLKYHLVLHLAGETEESHHTAESIIDVLKASRSPLSDALDVEEKPLGLFDDLPSLKNQSLWHGYQWAQIVEAWFGLFHQHLTDRSILVTLDRRLIDFVRERFEKAFGEDSERQLPEMITCTLPHIPATLSTEEISKTGKMFFPQGILDHLESALKSAENKRQKAAGATVKDPVVGSLLGRALVILVI